MKEIDTFFISKYKKNHPIVNYKKTNFNYLIDKEEVKKLKRDEELLKKNRRLSILNLKKITDKIVDIGLDYLLDEKEIYATIFDKDGIKNTEMGANVCKFPFLNTKTLKLNYKCVPNHSKELVCPVKINTYRKPMKWGYCPENPKLTDKRFKKLPVFATGDKLNGVEEPTYQEPLRSELINTSNSNV